MNCVRALTFLSVFVYGVAFCELPRPHATVNVKMRDGKELPTDIYLPSPEAKNLPAILVRSPSGRDAKPALMYLTLLNSGYLVAIQSTRSNIDPDGKTMPCIDDGWGDLRDGHDTITWLSENPLSNGKIGTVGVSALGITQLMMAPNCPPSLVCQYIQFACGSIYHHAAYPGGQLHKNQIESWLHYYAKHPSTTAKVKSERNYSHFWQRFDSLSQVSQVKVPALFYAGWFDTFLQGTIDSFLARQTKGGPGALGNQKLIIGPWAHFWPVQTKIGDFDVPAKGYAPPFDITPERWFGYYLKGEQNGIGDLPAVLYYVMGPMDSASPGHVWKESPVWPPASQPLTFYLTSNNSLHEEKSEDKTFSYIYDPNNPVPTTGGNNLFIESGPKDQTSTESRSDVVVFTSHPLEKDLEITGSLEAKIFFATDSEDTDLAVRLTDVYNGKSILIQDNLVRVGAQVRMGLANPHEITVPLNSTSYVFAKGHKIRVSISSSNYPRFEKNLNVLVSKDGEPSSPPKPAMNTIFVGPKYPSRIILPKAI